MHVKILCGPWLVFLHFPVLVCLASTINIHLVDVNMDIGRMNEKNMQMNRNKAEVS